MDLTVVDEHKAGRLLHNRGVQLNSTEWTETINRLTCGPLICLTVDHCELNELFE